jgi:hypothetical protein
LDFEQLAFIEKWRRRAVRGVVVGLDATRGDIILTLRVGDLGPPLDLSGRDETGAVRKQRLTIGDRVFVAFRYRVTDATPGTGARTAGALRKGAEIEGELAAVGELAELDLDGVKVIVEGDLAAFSPGETVRARISDDGAAYVIPTR